MYNTQYVDPRPKSSRSYNIQSLTPELSLETDFSLSKKVSIAVLRISIVVVASQLPSQRLVFSIASIVDYALLPRRQTPKSSIDQLLSLYQASPIADSQHGILGLNVVARRVDIEGILQLHSLLKLLLAEQRQGPSQEHKQVAQVIEEHQPPKLPLVLVSSSKRKIILVNNYPVQLPSYTQICSLL